MRKNAPHQSARPSNDVQELLDKQIAGGAISCAMDIRAALRSRGHRQRDVAARLGVTEPTVSRWFAWARDNKVGVPIPADALPVLAEMTGFAPADLRPDLANALRPVRAVEAA